jgi:serine phosphatase RsbU (regulator of sigma subunit)
MAQPRNAAEAIAALLELSHRLAPDDVGPVVREMVAPAGFADCSFYLSDYEQRVLVPLPPAEGDPFDIDTTLAGRCFRHVEVVEVAGEDGAPNRLIVPLLDGSERVGVMVVEVAALNDKVVADARQIASLTAELIVSKQAYGDHLLLVRRRADMDIAAEMRWALLPPLTFTTPRIEVSGVLEPAYEIAGDAFDYALNGDVLHLAVIDAMGHGLEASRMANLAIGSYRHARRVGMELVDMYRSIDAAVWSQFGDERFVTGHLARLHVDTGLLRWLNAGHPRPLLLRDASVITELAGETCLPIGLGGVPTEIAEVQLEPGDTVLFFSDGVTEARSEDGELFGEGRLIDHLTRAAVSREPLPELMRRLAHAIVDHEGHQLRDDATLLAACWHGHGPSDLLTLPPTPAERGRPGGVGGPEAATTS